MRVLVDEWNHERQKELLSPGWEFEGYSDGRIILVKKDTPEELMQPKEAVAQMPLTADGKFITCFYLADGTQQLIPVDQFQEALTHRGYSSECSTYKGANWLVVHMPPQTNAYDVLISICDEIYHSLERERWKNPKS